MPTHTICSVCVLQGACGGSICSWSGGQLRGWIWSRWVERERERERSYVLCNNLLFCCSPALFNADCDSAPNAPESLIQLNHKISHQVCTYCKACSHYVTGPSVTSNKFSLKRLGTFPFPPKCHWGAIMWCNSSLFGVIEGSSNVCIFNTTLALVCVCVCVCVCVWSGYGLYCGAVMITLWFRQTLRPPVADSFWWF